MNAVAPRKSPKWLHVSRWLLGGLLLFLIGLGFSVIQGVNTWDEAWFLQVVHRVAQGEVLYRDIFFGVTPLTVYLVQPLALLFGSELILIKAVMAVCYALTVLLVAAAGRALGHKSRSVLILAVGVFFLPPLQGPYKAAALVFLLACFLLALRWINAGEGAGDVPAKNRALMAAGASAALSFLSDQLFGAYAVLALAATIIIGSTSGREARRWRAVLPNLLRTALAFGVVTAVLLVPVLLSGGAAKFADYGFLNKSTYVRVAGVSYLDQLAPIPHFLSHPSLGNFNLLFRYSVYVLPIFVLPLLILRATRITNERRRTTVLLVFAGAAFLTAFPRVDIAHFVFTVPLLLVGLSHTLQEPMNVLSQTWRRLAAALMALWLLAGLSVTFWVTYSTAQLQQFSTAEFPHFRDALFQASQQTRIRRYVENLKQAAAGEPLLIVTPDAGFYYLISDLKDPTPYDFPLVTAFGTDGEARLVASLRQGEIRKVCLKSLLGTPNEYLRPKMLETYVMANMKAEADLGLCTLYTQP